MKGDSEKALEQKGTTWIKLHAFHKNLKNSNPM